MIWSPSTVSTRVITGYYVDNPGFLNKVIEFNTSFSTTSVLIGIGSKTFATQTGLSSFYTVGSDITIKFDETRQMYGTVTSYNNTTGSLVCNITSVIGSGIQAVWSIQLVSVGRQTFEFQVFNGDTLYMQALSGGSTSTWYPIDYDQVSYPNVFSTYTLETQAKSGTCQFAFFENLGFVGNSVTAHPSIVGIYCVNMLNPGWPISNPTPYNPLISVVGGGTTNLTANIVQNDWDAVGGYSTVFRVTTLTGTAATPYQVIFTAESGI